MNHERRPPYGDAACGYRWPSADGLDMHGCGYLKGHRNRHRCTCGEHADTGPQPPTTV